MKSPHSKLTIIFQRKDKTTTYYSPLPLQSGSFKTFISKLLTSSSLLHQFKISFNKDYPYKSPEIISLNDHKHPNIDIKNNLLYLEILNEFKWVPTYTQILILIIINSIYNILLEAKQVLVYINFKYIPKNPFNIELSKKYNGKQEMMIEENNDEDTDEDNQIVKQTPKIYNFDIKEGSEDESSHVSQFMSQCFMEEEKNLDDSNDTESEGKSSCPQFIDLSMKPRGRYIEDQHDEKKQKEKIF